VRFPEKEWNTFGDELMKKKRIEQEEVALEEAVSIRS